MKLTLHSTLAPLPSLWETSPVRRWTEGAQGTGDGGPNGPHVDVIVGNPPFKGDKH